MLNLHILSLKLSRILLRFFYIFPIQKKTILFMSYNGKSHMDSPGVIFNALLYSENKLVWALNDIIPITGAKVVRKNSYMYFYYILTSKIIVVNDFINTYIPIRKRQVLINTWHGGGSFKTVAMTVDNSEDVRYSCEVQSKMTDTFLSTSEFFTSRVLKDSFLFNGNILNCGLPRNDVLYTEKQPIIDKVYRDFNIDNDTKIILYAPTFRGKSENGTFLTKNNELNVDDCIREFEKKFNKKFVLLFRAHHALQECQLSNILDASFYPTIEPLLISCFAIITDYSSCMWEAALLRKPCFIYAPDLEEYKKERNFLEDFSKWPFPLCENNKELSSEIKKFDYNIYINKCRIYIDRLKSYENGNATEECVNYILDCLERGK